MPVRPARPSAGNTLVWGLRMGSRADRSSRTCGQAPPKHTLPAPSRSRMRTPPAVRPPGSGVAPCLDARRSPPTRITREKPPGSGPPGQRRCCENGCPDSTRASEIGNGPGRSLLPGLTTGPLRRYSPRTLADGPVGRRCGRGPEAPADTRARSIRVRRRRSGGSPRRCDSASGTKMDGDESPRLTQEPTGIARSMRAETCSGHRTPEREHETDAE